MPWTAADATRHSKKATTDKLKRQWAKVANSARQQCIDGGGNADECDASAVRQANAAIAKEAGEMGDNLQEALTKKVAGHNLKSGDFLVVEDPEKTTTWHLPVKVNGKPDRKLAAAAWAALFSKGGHRGNRYEGPKAGEAKRKLKALYKSEGWEQPASESDIQAQAALCEVDVQELFGLDFFFLPPPVMSFADLDAKREADEKIITLQARVDDLLMLVNNVLWESMMEDRATALQELFDEFVVITRKALGEKAPEPEAEQVEEQSVDLAEQAAMLSVTEATIDDLAQFDELLSEQRVELANPRRAPVLVDFAIIKPGHGNQKDRHYYPAEMLERDGGLFEGVDIFVTNHDPDEKTERNKVGRFRNVQGLREQGLVGTSILYDPDVAEKARNRADAGELDTLHCSILASGTGKTEEMDGQEVTVIESITKVHSVDLVSKAGAGGHAIALSEAEEPMEENQEQDREKQQDEALEEAQTKNVEIQEEDKAPEPEEAGEQAPVVLSAEAVTAILDKAGLDEKARRWLVGKEYQDEDAVGRAVEEMNAFIAEIAPRAGEPFALGETAPAAQPGVPKVLTREEMEERARERTRKILKEHAPTIAVNL